MATSSCAPVVSVVFERDDFFLMLGSGGGVAAALAVLQAWDGRNNCISRIFLRTR
jgi:hypothetical protein